MSHYAKPWIRELGQFKFILVVDRNGNFGVHNIMYIDIEVHTYMNCEYQDYEYIFIT